MKHHHHTSDNHSHKHHSHAHGHPIVKNMFWAFVINAVFTVIEFIGGIAFNSTAILADAVHDLGDSIALGLAIIFEKKSYKDSNKQFTFGYRRLSVISGLITGAILISGSIIMAVKSVERLIDPQQVNSVGMIWMAVLGVAFNGIAVLSLKRQEKGINAKVLYLHLLEDALGWIVVLIGALGIYFFNLPIIDPILSLGLSIYIAFNAVKLLVPVYHILMESTPTDLNLPQLEKDINSINEVIEIHDVHTWSLDGEYHVLSAHVIVQEELDAIAIIKVKKKLIELCKSHDIFHTTFEIEKPGEECLSNCD